MRTITGSVDSTPLPWLHVLSHMAPPHLRRKLAAHKEWKKCFDSSTNCNLPIRNDLENPPSTRLRSPIWNDADIQDQTFNINEAWKYFWNESGYHSLDLHINNTLVEGEVKIEKGESAVHGGPDDIESSQCESNAESGTHSMTDKQLYEYYKRLCQEHSFKPPIPLNKFEKNNFRYVSNIKPNELQPGFRFLSNEELLAIPRKIKKTFCHPGPERKCELCHWYLVDSIIQKVNLKCDTFPNFVVRWVGYEDTYNTVEPLAFVKHTAIYKWFKNPEIYTACRSNNSCLRRPTTEHSTESLPCNSTLVVELTKYDWAINKLVNKFQVEERADRYEPEIGFFSRGGNLVLALNAQSKFIRKVFIPLIKELNAPVVVDKHYIGTISGNLQATKSLKKIQECQSKLSVKTYIEEGVREAKEIQESGPHYVCFFVPKKHDGNILTFQTKMTVCSNVCVI